VVTTFAGSGHAGYIDDAHGLLAEFDFPADVAVDETGNVYVADEGNNKIRKITASGSVSTLPVAVLWVHWITELVCWQHSINQWNCS